MKNQARDYITNLANAQAEWAPAQPKLLDSSDWQEEWLHAGDMGRDNLAHGWLACWVEAMDDMSQSQARVFIHRTMIVKRAWFRTIEPHIRTDALQELGFPAVYDKLHTLLAPAEKPDTGLTALKKLWFGSSQEQLEALSEVPQTKYFASTYGALVPALAWDVARYPTASHLHRSIAGGLSVEYGRSGQRADYVPHIDTIDQMWRSMGEVADAYAENVSYDRIGKNYFEKICAMPPSETALPLLHLLEAGLRNTGKADGLRLSRKTVLGSQCPDAKPFDALRTWMPQRKAALDMAEATGMSYQETLALISTEVTTHSNLAFPAELFSDNSI